MQHLTIYADRPNATISRHLFGHFSEHLGRCIYGGLYVGKDSAIPNERGMRTDVVQALRHIRIPNLRWPGGCFADEYHWMDGIGPSSGRKRMVNTHWGGVVEDNSFGTHEFMDLCEQLGCEPYINGNLGSGTVREMQEWVEYMTFNGVSPMAALRKENGQDEAWALKYFGVGNENWGCGGNMRPEYYADEYRRYQTYVRNYGQNQIYKIACGASDFNYAWTEVLMREAGRYMDGLSVHYYTVPNTWKEKGSATEFSKEEYYTTLRKALAMDELLTQHSAIMDRYDPERRVGLIVDEWGTWFDVEPGTNPGFLYQQNTMRDAMVASATLDLFIEHAKRVHMANIAQMVNVLQSVLLTDGDQMIKTPTYHVFDLYKAHQDAQRLACALSTDTIGAAEDRIARVGATASVGADGRITATVSNRSDSEAVTLCIDLPDVTISSVQGQILAGAIHDKNTFEDPNAVKLRPLEGISVHGTRIEVTLPACSVAALEIAARP